LPSELACNLKIFEPGRALDDYGVALVRFENGALATVTASQISHGRENDIFIEVDGTKGALEWHQEEPNKLLVRKNGDPHKLYTRNGGGYLGALHNASVRLPSGHPEAFFEAFANVYSAAYDAIVKRTSGEKFETVHTIYPNVYDGVEGMLFITQCVASSSANGAWVPFRHPKSRK
jgi:predicted dehydrogenase